MKVAHVQHGSVVRYYNEEPFTFNGLTRFRSLPDAQKLAAGIYPVVDVTLPYGPEFFQTGDVASAVIFADRVEVVYTLFASDTQAAAIEAGGAARTERKFRRLAESDPVQALLLKGGLSK